MKKILFIYFKKITSLGFVLASLILLNTATKIFGQNPGIAGGFAVDSNLYSGVNFMGIDDWFQGASGDGMLSDVLTPFYFNQLSNNNNITFIINQDVPLYATPNGFLLYDSKFIRDHIKFSGSEGDPTTFGTGSKNGEDPVTWTISNSGNISGANDIVDAYIHLRRDGPTLNDSLWLVMGITTQNTQGDHYFDFELFNSDVTYSAGTGFGGVGPDEGHNSWNFNGSGSLIETGDMIVGFGVSGGGVTAFELRIWTSRANFNNVIPTGFTWGAEFDGGSNNSQYGYAQILVGDDFKAVVNKRDIPAAPWGTHNTGGNFSTTYPADNFGEVAVNLTAIGLNEYLSLDSINPCSSTIFKVMAKSRSSQSFTSALNDFTEPFEFSSTAVIDTAVTILNDLLSCDSAAVLIPENPVPGAFYEWITLDGQFDNGTMTSIGDTARAVLPGTYILSTAPLEECVRTESVTTIDAYPCAFPDLDTVQVNSSDNVIVITDNDYDLDGNLDITSIDTTGLRQSTYGTVALDPSTGSIRYTPFTHYAGFDTLEYYVCDLTNKCDTTEVIIFIEGEGCFDGIDNDGDGFSDYEDPDCGCPSSDAYTRLDFSNFSTFIGNGLGVGQQVRYLDAAIVGGENVNIAAVTVDFNGFGNLAAHGEASSEGFPGDGLIQLPSTGGSVGSIKEAEIQYTIIGASSNTQIPVSFELEIKSIELTGTELESIQVISDEIGGYSISANSSINTTWGPNFITFGGGDTHAYSDPDGTIRLQFTNVSQFTLKYRVQQLTTSSISTSPFIIDGNDLTNLGSCNPCIDPNLPDSDADGINNICDIDDDNDGILDVDEGCIDLGYVAGNWTSNPTPSLGEIEFGFYSDPRIVASAVTPASFGPGIVQAELGGNDDFPGDTNDDTATSMAVYGVDQDNLENAIIGGDYIEFEFLTTSSVPPFTFLDKITYAAYYWNNTNDIVSGGDYSYSVLISDDNFSNYSILTQDVIGMGGNDIARDSITFNDTDYRVFREYWNRVELNSNTTYTIRIYLFSDEGDGLINIDDVGFGATVCEDCDSDLVDNSLDLDSDNDGLLDVYEAGHDLLPDNTGRIQDVNSYIGANGLDDRLETVADSDSINYQIADSELSPDGTYDFCELDSDDDGCFDADEEEIVDLDEDGLAGSGVPIVDSSGLVIVNLPYPPPAENVWQNPLIAGCDPCYDPVFPDSDQDGFNDVCDLDDDNDGIPDSIEIAVSNVKGLPDCATDPVFDFSAIPILLSGTDRQEGATYRYTNVDVGVDAIVTIESLVNISIPVLDDNGTNPEFFNPQSTVSGLALGESAYQQYRFEFVQAGTFTPVTLGAVNMVFNDNDGGSNFLSEQIQALDPSLYAVHKPTELTISQNDPFVVATGGTMEYTGVTNDFPQVNFYIRYENRSDFVVRFGILATRDNLSAGGRQHSLSFSCLHNFTDSDNFSADVDLDGIPNRLDLDSDNDGILDVYEAGHNFPPDSTGRIAGVLLNIGNNGLDDRVENSDDGILNYDVSDSEAIPDTIYDPYELDSDGDFCFDAFEESVADSENDGLAGTGVPIVDSLGLVIAIQPYVLPPNNEWQDEDLVACPEICDDGIDNDGDDLTDCEDPDCDPLPIDSLVIMNPTNCPLLTNGTISIAVTSDSIEFSIDGGVTYQDSSVFYNLEAGDYNIWIRNNVTGCDLEYDSNPIVLVDPTCVADCGPGCEDFYNFNWFDGAGGQQWTITNGESSLTRTYTLAGTSGTVDVDVTLDNSDGQNIDFSNCGTPGNHFYTATCNDPNAGFDCDGLSGTVDGQFSYGCDFLTFGITSDDSDQETSFTFDFQFPTKICELIIGDIDFDATSSIAGSWQDEIDISADSLGFPVNLNVVHGGAVEIFNNDTPNVNILADVEPGIDGNLSPNDAQGHVSISSETFITSFTITYSNGPEDDGESDDHAIRISSFEVCPSSVCRVAITNPHIMYYRRSKG